MISKKENGVYLECRKRRVSPDETRTQERSSESTSRKLLDQQYEKEAKYCAARNIDEEGAPWEGIGRSGNGQRYGISSERPDDTAGTECKNNHGLRSALTSSTFQLAPSKVILMSTGHRVVLAELLAHLGHFNSPSADCTLALVPRRAPLGFRALELALSATVKRVRHRG